MKIFTVSLSGGQGLILVYICLCVFSGVQNRIAMVESQNHYDLFIVNWSHYAQFCNLLFSQLRQFPVEPFETAYEFLHLCV